MQIQSGHSVASKSDHLENHTQQALGGLGYDLEQSMRGMFKSFLAEIKKLKAKQAQDISTLHVRLAKIKEALAQLPARLKDVEARIAGLEDKLDWWGRNLAHRTEGLCGAGGLTPVKMAAGVCWREAIRLVGPQGEGRADDCDGARACLVSWGQGQEQRRLVSSCQAWLDWLTPTRESQEHSALPAVALSANGRTTLL
ncbi:hypothetical protein NDU88_003929 [Pleurodeles waltl]|uniref:Uncharacterized protein n=1 Tax=Pleurodeles waltl TaxID=8319 RepID=A0AAV7RHN3_PLEWA|nr:hypothetical protein NDU88_003929 [Pleurodeles waltl]